MSGRYRSAVAAYVRGHDRVWPIDRKRGGLANSADSSNEIEWSSPPAAPSFGVGVARALGFERGPGNARADRASDGAESKG